MNKLAAINVLGQNRILSGLPGTDYRRLQPRLERVSLKVRDAIYDADQPMRHVYFPLSGVSSVVVDTEGGLAVEVGTIGNEGMVGTAVFLGADRQRMRSFQQITGEALRMATPAFKREIARRGALHERVSLHTQAWMSQIGQSVACNSRHAIEQRTCRWLLQTHDRVGVDEFHLTQEFLAQMLAVRRPSVTVAAGMLQRAGLITYQRGVITIADRHKLEAASCECYETVKQEYRRLLG
jgi:CRP-like cAMP-binding protein